MLDIVTYEGESFIALKSTTGNPPAPGENWQLIAAAGENIMLRSYDNHIQWKRVSEAAWTNLLNLDEIKGEQGDKGERGFAGTISVGSVTSVESGQPAKVTNVGTSQDALFNFEIPKGASGSGSGDMLTSVYDPDQTGVVLAAEHADEADKLSEAIDIEITGAVTGTATSVDGSTNISIATQIPVESITPNKLDRAYVEKSSIGKQLYYGNPAWETGELTVPDFDKYTLVAFHYFGTSNLVFGVKYAGWVYFIGSGSGSATSQQIQTGRISYNGNTLTYDTAAQLRHSESAGHTTITTHAIDRVIGII